MDSNRGTSFFNTILRVTLSVPSFDEVDVFRDFALAPQRIAWIEPNLDSRWIENVPISFVDFEFGIDHLRLCFRIFDFRHYGFIGQSGIQWDASRSFEHFYVERTLDTPFDLISKSVDSFLKSFGKFERSKGRNRIGTSCRVWILGVHTLGNDYVPAEILKLVPIVSELHRGGPECSH